MKKRSALYLAASLVAHVVILVVLFFSRSNSPRPPVPRSIVELLADRPIAKLEPHDRKRLLPIKRRRTGDSQIFQPTFRPNYAGQLRTDGDVSAGRTGSDGRARDEATSEWGTGSRDFSRVEDLGRFDRLYDLIDSRVVYPSALASRQIQGTVNARLILMPNGQCAWAKTQIQSHQPHLRIYVLDILKSVCSQDLKRYARRDADTNLDLSFAFEITEHNEKKLIDAQKKLVGNVFLFYRNSQQSVAEWHLGPFHGLFPIPYVYLDFDWLLENYERVMRSKDPMNEFKDHVVSDPNPKTI